jgi:subtilisin
VAVIDTGIAYTHPELSPNYIGGYNFVTNTSNPMDDHGHGTHVAGTIAAIRNGAGVVGAAPDVSLYALKVLAADGSGHWSDIVAALEWADEHGIQITNNSYGSSTNPGPQVQQAFDSTAANGILHIAAAGNNGSPSGRGNTVNYPARWESVMAVAAIDQSNKRASWSSTGDSLEVSAPGVSINSTWLNGSYRLASGTSMASPHVAGAAALVMANGVSDAYSVRAILRDTATYLGNPSLYGAGLINAYQAVTLEAPPDNEPPSEDPTNPPEEEDKCPPGWQRQGRC